MKIHQPAILLSLALLCAFTFISERKTPFSFKESEQGIELFEKGKPVFYYQRKPKSLTGKYVCNNYIHPLYTMDGDPLTEEFPADHPHHRGIFWAWHQVFVGDQNIGDSWEMKNISQEITGLHTEVLESAALLNLEVYWKSTAWKNGQPFIHEHTTILVHSTEEGARIIDFEISLKAMVPGVSIGGSDDEKGYGGFSTRIKMPDDLAFTSVNGPVIPQELQIKAGPWMDFSGSFGSDSQKSGLTVLCHPTTPNYPAPWILRQKTSMQNCVFPGRQRIELPLNKPVVLRYRLVVHKGSAANIDISGMQAEYGKVK